MRGYVLLALAKLCAQSGERELPGLAAKLLRQCERSRNTDLW